MISLNQHGTDYAVLVQAPYSEFSDIHIIVSIPASHRVALKLENRQEDGLAKPRNNLRRHGFTSCTEEAGHIFSRGGKESGLEFE